jgi:two-component system, chemotaxis family, sensor kinase CheA
MARAKNLRLRLSAGALLPLIVAVAAQAAYTLVSQRDAMDKGLENKARALAGLMVNVAGPNIAFDDDKAVGDGLGYVAGDPDFGFAAAIGAGDKARLIAFRGDHVAQTEVAPAMTAAAAPAVRRQGTLLIAAQPVVTDGKQVGTVFVGLRSEAVRAEATHMAEWAAGISIIGIAIAVVVVVVLAGKIARRNSQMRVVLDNVEEALATLHRDGTLDSECSAAFARWFGAPGTGHFAAQVAGSDARMVAMLRLAWDEIVEGAMPLELLVDQFPDHLERDDRHFRLDIKPLTERDDVVGALLRIRDVTAEVETQRVLTAQREYVAVFERAIGDPHGVREFIEDTRKLVDQLPADGIDPADRKRAAHTIKGNAALYGVTSVAEIAHRLEDTMAESDHFDPAMVEELAATWSSFATRVEHLIGDNRRHHVDIPRAELEALADLAERAGVAAAERLRALLLEPVAVRLDGFRRQMTRLAERLGKPAPEVVIDAEGVRLPADQLRPFWSAFSHLVRNALDHGIEAPADRVAAGKSEAGHIVLRARNTDAGIAIEVIDDGKGIDWERVRDKARAAGLAAETRADLVEALFSDGVSTAAAVSQTSGRGVGLAAVRAAAFEAHGTVAIESEPGHGTRFTFTFTISAVHPRRRPATRRSLPPVISAMLPVIKGD